jgi:RES domain-containing protein
MRKLTKRHLVAMRKVKDGGDVFDKRIAELLREVQQISPRLIDIGKPRAREYTGIEQMPYFGANLTDAGRVRVSRRSWRTA